MYQNKLRALSILKRATSEGLQLPAVQAPVPTADPKMAAIGGNTSATANHAGPIETAGASSPEVATSNAAPPLPSRNGEAAPAVPKRSTPGGNMNTGSTLGAQKFAAALMGMDQSATGGPPAIGGTGMEQMQGQMPGQGQEAAAMPGQVPGQEAAAMPGPVSPEVDQAVRTKMQYKWRDKVQKIEQGKQKLDLERDQADAQMQLEEKQMTEGEQLKHEQKQFDEQQKVQQQMAKAQEAMPQFPMGGQAQAQSPGMAQQQPGLAAQQQPQPQVQKLAAAKEGPGFWGNIKTTLDDDAYFKEMGYANNPLKDKVSREKYLADNPAVMASAMSGPIGLIVYRSQQLANRRKQLSKQA